MAALSDDELMILCADHGNDPVHSGWDHTREAVPALLYGKNVKPVDLGVRNTFADIGATAAEALGASPLTIGTSFLAEILK
jgi:phosphopentomutase